MWKRTAAGLCAGALLIGTAAALAGPTTEPVQPVPPTGGKGDPQSGPGGGQPSGAPTPPAAAPSPTPSPTPQVQKVTKSRSNIQNN